MARLSGELTFCEPDVRVAMNTWLPRLARLVDEGIDRRDSAWIWRTAATFMVARSFPRQSGSARADDFAPVVPLLARALEGLSADNLVERVEGLADDISNSSGLVRRTRDGRPFRTISAASKLVWTAAPEIGVIYDQWAYLRISRVYPITRGAYGGYVRAVREEMPRHHEFITAMQAHAAPELRDRSWLPGKVFDFCLYARAGREPRSGLQP